MEAGRVRTMLYKKVSRHDDGITHALLLFIWCCSCSRYLSSKVDAAKTASFLLAIGVNLLILTCYQAPTWEGGIGEAQCRNKFLDRPSPININALITFFGFFQTATSVLVVAFFYLNKGALIIRRGFDDRARRLAPTDDGADGASAADAPHAGAGAGDGGGGHDDSGGDHDLSDGGGDGGGNGSSGGARSGGGGGGVVGEVEDGLLRSAIVGDAAGGPALKGGGRIGRMLLSAKFLLRNPFFLWYTFYVCTVRLLHTGSCLVGCSSAIEGKTWVAITLHCMTPCCVCVVLHRCWEGCSCTTSFLRLYVVMCMPGAQRIVVCEATRSCCGRERWLSLCLSDACAAFFVVPCDNVLQALGDIILRCVVVWSDATCLENTRIVIVV